MSSNKIDFPLFALVFVCGGCLFALYFVFLGYFAPTLISLTNSIEIIIFYTLALRAVALFAVPRLRRLPGQIKLGVLSVESFVLILIIVWYIFSRDPGYNTLIGTILTSWIAAGLVVITPYTILEFMIGMYKSKTIANVLVMVVAEFASVIFLANIAFQISPAPNSLQQLGVDILTAIKSGPGTGITEFTPSNLIVNVIAVILYMSMILYIVLRHGVAEMTPSLPFILMLIGTITLFVWSSLALIVGLNIFVSLTAPGAGIPFILWVVLRGKK